MSKESHLKYYQENKDKISLKNKERRSLLSLEEMNIRKQKSKEYEVGNKDRIKKYHDNYYSIHKEEHLVRGSEYRKENPLKCKVTRQSYYLRNKEKVIEATMKWAKSHPDIMIKARKKYYYNNRKKCLERLTRYFRTPKGKLVRRIHTFNRQRNLGGSSKLTLELVQRVYEENIKEYGTLTCELCFKSIIFKEDSLEHFTPVSRINEFPGIDLNARNNLGVSHINCNSSKHDKTLGEWFELHPEFKKELRDATLL